RRLAELAAQIRACPKCPLHRSRAVAVPGDGAPSAAVMVIGEAPGAEEDKSGHPFVGAAGRLLDHTLADSGLSRDRLLITNVVKCRPPRNPPPRKAEGETWTAHYL